MLGGDFTESVFMPSGVKSNAGKKPSFVPLPGYPGLSISRLPPRLRAPAPRPYVEPRSRLKPWEYFPTRFPNQQAWENFQQSRLPSSICTYFIGVIHN